MHYFNLEMKVIHGWGTPNIVKQQKNVEWDVLLQAIFLYLQDKVVEKTSPRKWLV